ncbi:MAG: hypothetical protein JO354_14260 [Verrucomicrobia bacterium]|nr:hypothetical protein [Verrucomicrobiota bacterium]
MKPFVLSSFIALVLAGTAFGQTFTAPAQPRRTTRPQPAPPITSRDVEGVVPRAVRGGNPAQMLNPRAPAKYGTSRQNVMLKPDGSGRWNGIRLFVINF